MKCRLRLAVFSFILLCVSVQSAEDDKTDVKTALNFDDDEDYQDFLDAYFDELVDSDAIDNLDDFVPREDEGEEKEILSIDDNSKDIEDGNGEETSNSFQTGNVPSSDWECRYSWASKRCEPREYCEYKYQLLDATLSESCRRKNVKKAKHVVSGGFQVHPLVALTGATALFAGDLAVVALTPALKKAPLLTNVLQGFVLFFSGDTYFQVLEQSWGRRIGVKISRAVKSGLIGALNNGFVHYMYYRWIDKHFPYHKFTVERWGPKNKAPYKLIVAWTKYWIEWPTIGVYKIASSFILTSLLNNNLSSIAEKFRKRFMLTWLRSLQIWPLYDTFAYAYIPTEHRVLFNTFLSIAWGGYLSHISQPEIHEETVLGEEQVEQNVYNNSSESEEAEL